MKTIQLLVVSLHAVVAILFLAFGVRAFMSNGEPLGLAVNAGIGVMVLSLGVVVGRVAARRS